MGTPLPIAFIGLGIMGAPMAGHLLDAGYALAVYSRTKSKAAGLLFRGATWADSPAAAARDASIVFICVTDTPDVQAVLFDQDGIANGAKRGTIVVDHSTISPSVTREMAADLAKQNIILLDAPVSGGDVGARNATLSIMLGGERIAFDRVQPLLHHLGKTITYCGPSGSGQLTKLVNQILVSVTNLAVSEAMTFAMKAGIDPATTLAAVGGGAAKSWQLENLGPKMIAGDFAPGFMIDLQEKDLRLVLEEADRLGLSLAATRLVRGLFQSLQARGEGGNGTQALIRAVR